MARSVAHRARSRLNGLSGAMPVPVPMPMRRSVSRRAPMTPWLVHELRRVGLNLVCLDARHARAALKMQLKQDGRK